MGALRLHDPVTSVRGIGAGTEEKLERLGIADIRDLILHLPARYQDRTRSRPIADLAVGDEGLVTAEVASSSVAYGRRRSLVVRLVDGTGRLSLRLFHFSRGQSEAFVTGAWVRCFGVARMGPTGLEMAHPEYRIFPAEPPPPEPRLTPVYRQTEGISSTRLATWINDALARLGEDIGAELPDEELPSLLDAVRHAHRPNLDDVRVRGEPSAGEREGLAPRKQEPSAGEREGPAPRKQEPSAGEHEGLAPRKQEPSAGEHEESAPGKDPLEAARRRVVVDELLAHYLVMKRRGAARLGLRTTPLPPANQLGRELLRNLGFRLTGAQARVAREVLTDLDSPVPMMRLLQGDVGSGKTVIAAFAAIRAAEHEGQTALMAPTEILAEQHFETLSAWLTPLGIGVGLLTGRQTAAERRRHEQAARQGDALVVVGTHALFQSSVEFRRLALAIVDEQHRFGVHQRMMLRDKGALPHHLVMTATPIPRTLTMALYADMDVSVIDEMPAGRQPVRTHLVSMTRRDEIVDRVGRAIAAGAQAYWVCTVIDGSPDAGEGRPPPSGVTMTLDEGQRGPERAATTTFEEVRAALPGCRCGLVHGRLPAAEKAAAMAAFKAGDIDLLVATTVIEVGVDNPNATVMVIDNAERLGLAQLHQLRGRVGRGSARSECTLLYQGPLSAVARERLTVLRESNDGFVIAEKDLTLRGPGDILGTRQTGEQTFRVADLARDAHLIGNVTRMGDALLRDRPDVAARVIATWARGGDTEYAAV